MKLRMPGCKWGRRELEMRCAPEKAKKRSLARGAALVNASKEVLNLRMALPDV
jgi:hypothetical protein